ncbi:hypothetical protein CAL7716_059320 [Calothrix sp. PCC 7716]|nr:hypothetical protein CAL7716_059320 [Calothrix sp. PCC 7716]
MELSGLVALLNRQEKLLTEIRDSLNKPKLGLHNDAGACKIYCNRQHGSLWYTLTDKIANPVNESALTGYLKELKFEETERRGKPTYKLLTTIAAQRVYILESGDDSHFTKCLLSAIASLAPSQLSLPITISPQPGDDDKVLFCRVWIGSEYVKAPYSEDTDFQAIGDKAIALVRNASRAPVQHQQPTRQAVLPVIQAPQQAKVLSHNERVKIIRKMLDCPVEIALEWLKSQKANDFNQLPKEAIDGFIRDICISWACQNGIKNQSDAMKIFEKHVINVDGPEFNLIKSWMNYIQTIKLDVSDLIEA